VIQVKTIQVEIPEKLGEEIEKLIQGGWFYNEGELTREALREFIRQRRPLLSEKFMEEDIEWAVKLRKTANS
jgi:Arc/MetJ-type ribon-helix-helix transcriptional regulator